ncbi:hypothetical protein HYC85_007204 [Camellia sinensis]|uniref:Alpha-1,4 glucan phosphorylase n=1 Tax=Camellia sinensis TaxID=4442 RepID=A0A7J7HQS0_CAMSI|nr:hypothetical protein HYC85_007204 [Camellia sinensis]
MEVEYLHSASKFGCLPRKTTFLNFQMDHNTARGERCSSWKWGSGKASFLLSRFYGNIKFACMGVWFEVQIWAVQAAVWQTKKKLPKTGLRSLAIGKLSDMTLCSLLDYLVKLKYISLDRKWKWVGGEVVLALAYDVPIPGYKTKNTINLHLWEAKVGAEDFNLFQFNDGQYESAAQLHSRA